MLPGTVSPQNRVISWVGEKKYSCALEVFNEKIIFGWNNGQIGIYGSIDLGCQTLLKYCSTDSRVMSLHCTGTEIIAGYDDGNTCIWNMEKRTLQHTLSVANQDGREEYASSLGWRSPRLVVGTFRGKSKSGSIAVRHSPLCRK